MRRETVRLSEIRPPLGHPNRRPGRVNGSKSPSVRPPSPEPDRVVELRCPVGPRKLFAKLRLSGQMPEVNSDNLIELPCQNCRRTLQRAGRSAALVLHRFNIVGELIETEVVPDRSDGA